MNTTTPQTEPQHTNGVHASKAAHDQATAIVEVPKLSEIAVPTDSGENFEITAVKEHIDGEESYVIFTGVHSDTTEPEDILIPLANPTPVIMAEMHKMEGARLAKPNRILIEDFTKLGHAFAMVTPYEALMFLKNNEMQRGLKLSTVERYSQAHREGRWLPTNQGVGFDVDKGLADGQHRLFTCVLTGLPMPLLLVWGLSPEAREVVDCGVGRTPGQVDDMMNGRTEDLPPGTTIEQYTTKIFLAHGGSTNKARLYYRSIKNVYLGDLSWFNQYIKLDPKYPKAKKNMLNAASVCAAFLMLHHAFPGETEKFAEVVFSQDNPDHNQAVTLTRDYLNDRGETDDYLDVIHKILTGFFAYQDTTKIPPGEGVKELRALGKKPSNSKSELRASEWRRKRFYETLQTLWFMEPEVEEGQKPKKGKKHLVERCRLLPDDARACLAWDPLLV